MELKKLGNKIAYYALAFLFWGLIAAILFGLYMCDHYRWGIK